MTRPATVIVPVDELQVAGLVLVAVIAGTGFTVNAADAVALQVPSVAVTE